jgi:choline kinase
MKAILLAAGLGSRLAEHTRTTPKCLLPIGHTTVLEHTLGGLLAAGIDEIVVVTGYHREQIEACVARRFGDAPVRLVHNAGYRAGSGSSLMRALEDWRGGALVLEADLMCHVDILRRFVGVDPPNAIAIGDYGHDRIEGRVEMLGGRVRSITMRPANEPDDGAWIGITKLSVIAVGRIRASLALHAVGGADNGFPYSDHVSRLVLKHHFVGLDIDDLPWIEIDNEEDLVRARAEVYPRLYPDGAPA